MAAPFHIVGIDHVVLRAADPAALERFYLDVLGLSFEKRQGKLWCSYSCSPWRPSSMMRFAISSRKLSARTCRTQRISSNARDMACAALDGSRRSCSHPSKVRRATSKTCAPNGSGQWVLHQRRQWGVL